EVLVEDVLAIGLLPSPALPPRHPLRARVDHVLRVTVYLQVVAAVGGRTQQVEHGHELSPVVRRVLPSAGAPALVVDVPGPPGRARVAERGTVRGSDDRQWFSLDSRIPFCHASAAVPACGAVICLTSRIRSHGASPRAVAALRTQIAEVGLACPAAPPRRWERGDPFRC